MARYDKVHPPFGEYVPARGLVRRLADLSAVPRDALAGRRATGKAALQFEELEQQREPEPGRPALVGQ